MTAILHDDPPELAQLRAPTSAAVARSDRAALPGEDRRPSGSRRRAIWRSRSRRCPGPDAPLRRRVFARRARHAGRRAVALAAALVVTVVVSDRVRRLVFHHAARVPRRRSPRRRRRRSRSAPRRNSPGRRARDRSGDFSRRTDVAYAAGTRDASSDLHPAGHRRPHDSAVRRARARSSFSRAGRRTAVRSCISPPMAPSSRRRYGGAASAIAVGPYGAGSAITAAAWSPDGKQILLARGKALSVMTRDDRQRERAARHAQSDGLYSCDWSPRGDLVACACGNQLSVVPGPTFGNVAPSSIVVVPVGRRVIGRGRGTDRAQSESCLVGRRTPALLRVEPAGNARHLRHRRCARTARRPGEAPPGHDRTRRSGDCLLGRGAIAWSM